MSESTVVLDTSPLVLLVVGSVDAGLLGVSPHLKQFVPEDLQLLERVLSGFRTVATTPHVVTEAAHFITKISRHSRPHIRVAFVVVADRIDEIAVASRKALARAEFAWLDLADCTLLEAAGPKDVLLTTDSKLALQRQSLGFPAINFNHLREEVGIL